MPVSVLTVSETTVLPVLVTVSVTVSLLVDLDSDSDSPPEALEVLFNSVLYKSLSGGLTTKLLYWGLTATSFCIPESALLELAELLAVRGVLEAYEDVILDDLVSEEDSDGSFAVPINRLRLPELRDKLGELAR